MKRQFTIIDDLLEQLNKKVEQINRKARKINVPEVSYEIVETVYIDDRKHLVVETDVEVVKIPGYEVVAVIDHEYTSSNIVHVLNEDIELPSDLHIRKAYCEHCNTSRNRKKTVLLLNSETREFIQVGKSCIKDYTGYDLNSALSMYQTVEELEDLLQDTFSHGEGWTTYYNVKDVLNVANEYINRFGYVSAADADEENPKTGNVIWDIIDCIKSNRKLKKELEFCAEAYELESPSEKVQQIMHWVCSQDNESNYINNVRVLIDEKFVAEKNINILVSIIPTYNRHLERELMKKQKEKSDSIGRKNEHFGQVGDRQDFELTSIACYVSEGYYGITYVNKFLDNEGRTFVWFTTKKGYEQGTQVKIKGTIKEHSQFNNEMQTVLTRCKEL